MFRQCCIFWNCSDSVVYFRIVQTVLYILELFRQCCIFCFSFYYHKLFIICWSVCTQPGKWQVMYMCTMGVGFSSIYDIVIETWNYSVRVIFLCLMLFIAKERIGKKGYGCKWIRASIEIYTETRIKEQEHSFHSCSIFPSPSSTYNLNISLAIKWLRNGTTPAVGGYLYRQTLRYI